MARAALHPCSLSLSLCEPSLPGQGPRTPLYLTYPARSIKRRVCPRHPQPSQPTPNPTPTQSVAPLPSAASHSAATGSAPHCPLPAARLLRVAAARAFAWELATVRVRVRVRVIRVGVRVKRVRVRVSSPWERAGGGALAAAPRSHARRVLEGRRRRVGEQSVRGDDGGCSSLVGAAWVRVRV